MCRRPEVILENHYGCHQPSVFCENYLLNLMEQGLGNQAKVVMDADLTEAANTAWETILERFVPAEGYHLGYLDHDQALFMIPDGWEEEN